MKKGLLFLLFLFGACGVKSEQAPSAPGTLVQAPDGLYEFNLAGEWKEEKGPNPKIEKIFLNPEGGGRFFILRIPNPPHQQIDQSQLTAYVEGLEKRYQNVQIISQKVNNKYGTSIGGVIFTYEETTPKGPLVLRNFCEIMIHKGNYLNVCAVAPAALWEKKREQLLGVFPTFKLL